ncbi:alpha-L-fucosidase [Chryseolinea sp. T2]|uniref:alpha-L-fucosidase n=1 Tax=Chryseolinea sp. T2 TaxID=3129255 RepID=UPI0030773AFA
MRTSLLFAAVLLVACSPKKTVQAPTALGPVPSESQLAWHNMETNAFIHFTTNTFTDKEWGFGDESPKIFNPSDFDPNQWITTLKDTGFKGVILTCKHHDGFCLWPSQYTEHSIKNSPFQGGKGDIVKAVSDAARANGLKFGVYLSPWDRNRADYGTPEYITYYRNQLKELFTSYGPVFEMWFDGANGGDGYYGGAKEKRKIDGAHFYDWPTTLNMVREMEPDVIFFSDAGPGVRWVGNERGLAGETNWNTITPDTLYAGQPGITDLLNQGHENGTAWIPAEVDVSIRPGWFYHAKEDSLVKSPEQLFEIYLTSVGRGSTLLLNVPPDRSGHFHENDVAALKGFKALLSNEFRTNVAAGASCTATNVRGELQNFQAGLLTDGNPETYWATDDDVTTASTEISFKEAKPVKYVVLQEYIKLGQRVKSFNIEAYSGGTWRPLASATTIGYKRIIRVNPGDAEKIRINITAAKGCPLLSNVEVY